MKRIVLLLIIVMIIGCQKQTGEIVDPNFRTGTDGLVLTFQKNSPPSEIIEKSPFNVLVEVKNNGATTVKDGMLILSGYGSEFEREFSENAYIGPMGPESPQRLPDKIDIEGKTAVSPKGTFPKIFSYNFQNKARPATGKGSFTATACYTYETIAVAEMCVNPYGTDYLNVQQQACSPEKYETQTFSGQGAPVVVTKIEQKIVPKKDKFDILLTFYLENRGNGIVVEKSKYKNKCQDEPLNRDQIDKVSVKEISFSKYSKSRGEIKCDDNVILGKNTRLLCEVKNMEINPGTEGYVSSYLTQLIATFEYGYVNSASTIVSVKQLDRR